MIYKIEYSYISPEIQKTYEKFGGFATAQRLLFLSFKIDGCWITGIHMRGGLFGQVSKHFMGIFDNNILVPQEYKKYIKAISYCGLHATNIAAKIKMKQEYKTKKANEDAKKFKDYVSFNKPLFEFRILDPYKMEPILIDYEQSRILPFR
tara:strand:- start:27 stop:476 length:450 start_codon:yes stop_codon:yes gene_type:complete